MKQQKSAAESSKKELESSKKELESSKKELDSKKKELESSKKAQQTVADQKVKFEKKVLELEAQLSESESSHKAELSKLEKKASDDTSLATYMGLVSSLLQGEDILKGKEKKGLKMDNRACPKCNTPITKALSGSVGREGER